MGTPLNGVSATEHGGEESRGRAALSLFLGEGGLSQGVVNLGVLAPAEGGK